MIRRLTALAVMLFATAAMAMSLTQLNKASKEELMGIKGIGEKKAQAIIKARKKGKFTSYEDVMARVPGIGEQTLANIKGGVKNGDAAAKASKAKKKAARKAETKAQKAAKKADKAKRSATAKSAPAKAAKQKVKSKAKKAKKAQKALKEKKKAQKKKAQKAAKKTKKAA